MEHALIQSVLILFALLTTAKGAVDFAHDTARRLCLFGSLLMLLVAAGEVLDVVHFVGVYVYVYVYGCTVWRRAHQTRAGYAGMMALGSLAVEYSKIVEASGPLLARVGGSQKVGAGKFVEWTGVFYLGLGSLWR